MLSFDDWFDSLLMSCLDGKIVGHPLGSCKQRDVLRDKDVKKALKEAYERIILGE